MAVRELNTTELVDRTQTELKAFFGREVPVPQPPALLVETFRVAQSEGFNTFDPIYFPAVEFKQNSRFPGWQNSRFPGWQTKPEKWYWKQIKDGWVDKNAARFGGYWQLFDNSRRPNNNDDGGEQMFREDPLEPILARGRHQGKIAVPDYLREVPQGSRFGLSPDEQDNFVLPELAVPLRLVDKVGNGQAQLRKPTEMEFNFAGNLKYPHLGQANTWEWMNDSFKGAHRLFGGDSRGGGLADVNFSRSDDHRGYAAFRPVVAFLSQAA